MPDPSDYPRSSSKWVTSTEMTEFNIKVVFQDTQDFFGTEDLPIPKNISPIIWNHEKAPPGPLSKTVRHFFAYLEDAMNFPLGESSGAIDFAVFLLGMLDYDDDDDGRRVLHTRKDMTFCMEDGLVDATADATIIERQNSDAYKYILLVQEDRHYAFPVDPEAQLIAQAIGAFWKNSKICDVVTNSELESQTFPGITIAGTAATFYKITINRDLAMAVESGRFPENETIVHRFVPPARTLSSRGMVPLGNRRLLLQCFEAFKQFMADPPIKTVPLMMDE
ncbi:hypothetical protein DFP72DRAFT_1174929 [Ephemerocybe angulata]|uniref:Uncharacterized protein n=1 Tax=Ephemerocybe angulata TaxID=980116 RepID=A0A8H6HI60_9AGAR|nr:hypothetical protein DFP72DRAFT_1174929 [Tulosesus angulatus]